MLDLLLIEECSESCSSSQQSTKIPSIDLNSKVTLLFTSHIAVEK